ncbi:MAG: glycosyltransferase involved in cell wall biosynthesis [Flavobacteriales bacterium]|jgi:glycosyltransferase involved in cell wall biosynthesis
MKVLLLADINSSHTQKWVIGLSSSDIEVQVFSFNPILNSNSIPDQVKVTSFFKTINSSSLKEKIMYVFAAGKLKKLIQEFKPDYVHAHYASSYGKIGRMSKFKPFYISVWGSDVFDFPKRNPIFRTILKKNLNAAQQIFSSSYIMAKECELYTKKSVTVIPFGIDVDKFVPARIDHQAISIGVIKSLESIYAIDQVIRALALLKDQNLKLIIVGAGSKEEEYKKLSRELELETHILFKGRIPHTEIVKEYQDIDIFINVSHHESFGVSILEASACEIPVIAHNVGGMTEVVQNKTTGLLIKDNSPETIANAILKLINNPTERELMGKAGRKFVLENFDWKENLKKMTSFYS